MAHEVPHVDAENVREVIEALELDAAPTPLELNENVAAKATLQCQRFLSQTRGDPLTADPRPHLLPTASPCLLPLWANGGSRDRHAPMPLL